MCLPTSTKEQRKKHTREKKEEEGEQHHNKGKKEEMNERFLRHSTCSASRAWACPTRRDRNRTRS